MKLFTMTNHEIYTIQMYKYTSSKKECNFLDAAKTSIFAYFKYDITNRTFVDCALKQPLKIHELDSKVLLTANHCYFSANSLFLERHSFRIN